jgi:hypothetical protein
MVLEQVAPAASRRGQALCVLDAGASSLLTMTLFFREENGPHRSVGEFEAQHHR